MSRKDQSFGQLIAYMQDDGKSERDYDIYHHCFSRDRHGLESEFTANSALLPKRKNGNYLYHEIISITLEEGVSLKFSKNSLREIAEEWVQRRCPKNMVYGCLHADHTDHLHYHLMISANELGQSTRLSLTTHAFNKIKRELEAHVLQKYPGLKQKAIKGSVVDRGEIVR